MEYTAPTCATNDFQGFLSDYMKYRQQINGFDHHLSRILNLTFDESNGLDSAFKVSEELQIQRIDY